MEPENLLPHSQEPVPVLSQIDPVHASLSHFLKTILILSSRLRLGLAIGSFPQVSPPKSCIHLSSIPISAKSPPPSSHSSLFAHSNNIGEWYRSYNKSPHFVVFSTPCYLVPLRPKYLSDQPILEHPEPVLFCQCERQISTPIHNNRQNYTSVYLNMYV